MRVNIYAEEMTERVEIISKEIDGHTFTGLRLYLYLPVSVPNGDTHQGPFVHRDGDDDSSAVTFWGKRDLRKLLTLMKKKLDAHYGTPAFTVHDLCESDALLVELESLRAFKRSVDEALNSGDGVYRP